MASCLLQTLKMSIILSHAYCVNNFLRIVLLTWTSDNQLSYN